MSTPEEPQISLTEPSIERSTLREQVRRVLRTKIITGELEPGRLYAVKEFAETLSVSATPVREAVGDLTQAGLVQVMRNRGFVVPKLTDQDLDEIFQLRVMLEVPAVVRVAGAAPAAELAACRALVDQCSAAAQKRDLSGFLDSDREFHLRLIGICGNRRLVEIVDRLRDEARLYGLTKLSAADLVKSAGEHDELLSAVSTGDEDGARRQLTKHLEHTRGLWARTSSTARRRDDGKVESTTVAP